MPRHVPASVTELARVGLLATIPGDVLGVLAGRMEREHLPSGGTVVAAADTDARYHVLLSGVASLRAPDGSSATVRPGESFGRLASDVGAGHAGTLTALSPCTVASCDTATFDELIRPALVDAG